MSGKKKAEPELGTFDCVYNEPGHAPHVGKLHVYKTSLLFKAGPGARLSGGG